MDPKLIGKWYIGDDGGCGDPECCGYRTYYVKEITINTNPFELETNQCWNPKGFFDTEAQAWCDVPGEDY